MLVSSVGYSTSGESDTICALLMSRGAPADVPPGGELSDRVPSTALESIVRAVAVLAGIMLPVESAATRDSRVSARGERHSRKKGVSSSINFLALVQSGTAPDSVGSFVPRALTRSSALR